MRYASVCDGIGAVHCAWQPLGWSCEWTAEIDAFPAAVVEQRWGFPNRGDMTCFKEWDDAPIDLLAGGTPCQSFSVAGLRKGLHDPRGGLMLTFLEIAQHYRPRWIVWENVPGVLSSNGGRDFGSFLGALGHLGYGWAYRVLDAQWFGVAQRRRRVFVVGCLGDERRAAQVLFESESVRRDNPPSRAKGQGTAISPALRARANSSHRADSQAFVPDVSPALKARDYKGPSSDGDGASLVPSAFGGQMSVPQCDADLSQTLQAMAVRRLTPRECERLQGFPDDYTAIIYRNKTAADGPRYKALGNSMAVPVMRWLGERIDAVQRQADPA